MESSTTDSDVAIEDMICGFRCHPLKSKGEPMELESTASFTARCCLSKRRMKPSWTSFLPSSTSAETCSMPALSSVFTTCSSFNSNVPASSRRGLAGLRPLLPERDHAPVPLGYGGDELFVAYLAGQPAARRVTVYGALDREPVAQRLGGRRGEALDELLLLQRLPEYQQTRAVRVVLADNIPDPLPHAGSRVRRQLPPLGAHADLVEPGEQLRHAVLVVGHALWGLDLQQQLPVVLDAGIEELEDPLFLEVPDLRVVLRVPVQVALDHVLLGPVP